MEHKQKLWENKYYKQFKNLGFTIHIKFNVKIVYFLDISFVLNNTYKPYRKANKYPIYIKRNSNHLYHVCKHIPISINKIIATNSSNIKNFNKNKTI